MSTGESEKGAPGGSDGPTSAEVQEWENRLISGDLPDDFLNVTEPRNGSNSGAAAAAAASTSAGAAAASASASPAKGGDPAVATGTLVDVTEKVPVGRDPDQSAHTEPADNATKAGEHHMTTEEKDHAMAMALQKQLNIESREEEEAAAARAGAFGAAVGAAYPYVAQAPPANAVGRLTVTVAEAKLARNYGIARMDPYCRVRVGHCVYETPTCSNGAREPKWNKTFYCFLLAGVKTMDVEIYDECTFQSDALIAHATFVIPEEVTQKCEVVDHWWPLSGQEGRGAEGQLHLILSLQKLLPTQQQQKETIHVKPGQPVVIPQHQPPAAAAAEAAQVPPEPPLLSEEQLQEFCKMFPNLEKEVITSVFQENRGNQERTVNGLLLLSGS